jgi:hypothetical protein
VVAVTNAARVLVALVLAAVWWLPLPWWATVALIFLILVVVIDLAPREERR